MRNFLFGVSKKLAYIVGVYNGAVVVMGLVISFFAGLTLMCVVYEDNPEIAHKAFNMGVKAGSRGKSYSEFKEEKDCAEKHIGF